MTAVRLPRPIVSQLMQLAQKSPDEEICGLISRDGNGFRKCYPVPNRAADRKHFFTLDPRTQIDAMRAHARSRGGTGRHLSLPPGFTGIPVAVRRRAA